MKTSSVSALNLTLSLTTFLYLAWVSKFMSQSIRLCVKCCGDDTAGYLTELRPETYRSLLRLVKSFGCWHEVEERWKKADRLFIHNTPCRFEIHNLHRKRINGENQLNSLVSIGNCHRHSKLFSKIFPLRSLIENQNG